MKEDRFMRRTLVGVLGVTVTAATGLWLAAEAASSPPPKQARQRAHLPMPPIAQPVSFDTAEADKILEILQVFPPDTLQRSGGGSPIRPGVCRPC